MASSISRGRWQKLVLRSTFCVCAAALAAVSLLPIWILPRRDQQLSRGIQRLQQEVQELRQEQTMPVLVLNRHRPSICYLFGVYSISSPSDSLHAGEHLRFRFSGSGFVVGEGLIATNRHVAQPWYEDGKPNHFIRDGGTARLEKFVAYFPAHKRSFEVTPLAYSQDADLALLRFDPSRMPNPPPALALAKEEPRPGDPVVVVGYPLGITAMVAKSPTAVYQRLAYNDDDKAVADQLAQLSLIRPSATYGHLGDVLGDKLIYDAATAHGGSGGPIFNDRGEVIGINTAYLDGFTGSSLGVSVNSLRQLLGSVGAKR